MSLPFLSLDAPLCEMSVLSSAKYPNLEHWCCEKMKTHPWSSFSRNCGSSSVASGRQHINANTQRVVWGLRLQKVLRLPRSPDGKKKSGRKEINTPFRWNYLHKTERCFSSLQSQPGRNGDGQAPKAPCSPAFSIAR